jgi:hypothetical protein
VRAGEPVDVFVFGVSHDLQLARRRDVMVRMFDSCLLDRYSCSLRDSLTEMASVGKLSLPPTVPAASKPDPTWNQAQNIPNPSGRLVENLPKDDASATSSIFHGSHPLRP